MQPHLPGHRSHHKRRYARDVAIDEKAMIDAISELRQKESSSLEAIGYLMGADPAQLSRYLKGTRSTTLTNYLRIARALGIEAGWYWKKPTSAMPLQACFWFENRSAPGSTNPPPPGKIAWFRLGGQHRIPAH